MQEESMTDLELSCASLVATVDAKAKSLTFTRDRRKLPWSIDLGRTAQLTVGRGGSTSGKPHPVHLGRLIQRRLAPAHVQWVGEVAGAGVALELELTPDGLVFTVSPLGTGEAELLSARWPGELSFVGPEREVCWSDAQQGSLFRPDGKPWSGSVTWDHAAMRAYGFTCGRDSLAVIVDTPLDAEATFSDDGTSRMASVLDFNPSLGKLAYARAVRFLPLTETGHVAVANAFRTYAQRHELWRSWQSRVDENPNVARLKGAFIACAGYIWDPAARHARTMTAMRRLGFKHGYLFSPKLIKFGGWDIFGEWNRVADRHLREIHKLGYLTAPFLQVEESLPSLGADKFAVNAKGEKFKRWQINQFEFFEIAKWRVPAMLPLYDDRLQACSAIHFDTLTAMPLVENWGERPYDRRGDAALRRDIALYYRRRGKVIGSESMRDWGVDCCDLNTSKRFTPLSEHDHRVWSVPLSDLVYHDSHPRSHWEHHSYDDNRQVRSVFQRKWHPFAMRLMDLLTASPPVLFPEGKLYQFELIPIVKDGEPEFKVNMARCSTYCKRFTDPETQAALPKALQVCKLNERHGAARMLRHRFVDPNRFEVQETEFDTGLHVVVNFGDEPCALPDGRTVKARAALVDE